jgi:hypothetical protein
MSNPSKTKSPLNYQGAQNVYSVVGNSYRQLCLSKNYFALSDIIIAEESVAIVESVAIIEDESAIVVVVVSVVSVFFELQEVARAIIAMKKKADFVIAFINLGCFCLSETD